MMKVLRELVLKLAVEIILRDLAENGLNDDDRAVVAGMLQGDGGE